ncbi:MAG: aldo/keto reductase [Phycisphaeraceae bacterium]
MQYRTLGRTDIEVSTVAMGCWAIVGDGTWGPQDEQDAIDAIRAALDAGITFFDTAEAYGDGDSEKLLARGLADQRDRAVIASKVSPSNLNAADLRRACERSLKHLGTDYIDLYQVHWPNWDVPIDETFGALEKLRDQGKIRAIGVSNFGPKDLSEAINQARIESNQVAYNLLLRGVEHGIQPMCAEHGIAILPYSPLAQGLLTGKFRTADEVPEGRARTRHFAADRPQARHGEPGCERETFAAIDGIRAVSARIGQPMGRVALAWLLHQPAVASVLAGARNPAQARENAQAADVTLSDEVLRELDELTQPVKRHLGANPDPWQPAETRMR